MKDKILHKPILLTVIIALFLSIASSIATYYFFKRDYPRFVVVDLHYLQTEFIKNLSRYITNNHADIKNENLARIIDSEQHTLEELLVEISNKENFIILQKQTVAAGNLQDVTELVEKQLFQIISKQIKSEVNNDKEVQ